MSQLYSQGEPPKDANGWLWWLIFIVGGGLVSAVVSLAKMIKSTDTTRIQSLEEEVDGLKKRCDQCETDRSELRVQLVEVRTHLGLKPDPET